MVQIQGDNTSSNEALSGGRDLTLSTLASNRSLHNVIAEKALEHSVERGGLSILGAAFKKVPVLGAVFTASTALWEVGGFALNGKWDKAGAATLVGGAEVAGSIVGFGVGDAAREAARSGIILAAGEEFAEVEKSDLRQLSEGLYAMTESQAAGLARTPKTGHIPFSPVADPELAARYQREQNLHVLETALPENQRVASLVENRQSGSRSLFDNFSLSNFFGNRTSILYVQPDASPPSQLATAPPSGPRTV